MRVAKVVLKNVAASWVGLGSQVVVTFLLTPFVIRMLGTEAYGVWLLLQGFVGYYGLVDMGLRAGLTQSITRRIAANEIDSVRRHIASAMPLLGAFSALIIIVAVAISFLLPTFVEMSSETANVIWLVVLIQAIGTAVKMPITPYGAVLVGLQRYDVANAISIFTQIIFAITTWIVLSSGYGLVGLSVVMMLTNCLDSFMRMTVAKRMLPGICGAGITLDRSELKEITNVGIWNFLIGISRQFIYFSDALVVGVLFSAQAVAPYGIAASLVEFGNRLVVASTKVLFPTMTHLSKNGSLPAQRELYITATRMTLGVSFTILVLGVAWISPFLKLWLGDSPGNQIFHEQAPLIFTILGMAFAFVGFQRAGIQLLLANNRLRQLATLMLAEALLNLVTSLLLGWYLGPLGVAFGTLIPAAVLSIFVHVPIHAKSLGLTYTTLLGNVLLRPLLFFTLLAGGIATVKYFCPTPTNWNSLVLLGGLLSLLVVAFLSPILLSTRQLSLVKRIGKEKVVLRMLSKFQAISR